MSEQKIICFAGKAGSGKTTACNFLVSLVMNSLGIANKVTINKFGRIWVHDLFGDESQAGVFDVQRETSDMKNFLAQYLDPFVKMYSFADLLKRNVAMQVLGMSYEDCYSENGKLELSKFKWEDMPGVITDEEFYYQNSEWFSLNEFVFHKPGLMSNREVLQFVGTNIFRKMYSNVWAERTLNVIKEEETPLSIISDGRFKNEFLAVQEAGGIVIRLTRNSGSTDQHPSEKEMDEFEGYNLILDNSKMSIGDQNKALYEYLKDEDVLPELS